MKRKNKPQLSPQLSIENARTLHAKTEWEGDLLYVVENWEFKEFKDKKFSSLRKAVVKAMSDFTDYCALERVAAEEIEGEEFDPVQGMDDASDYTCEECGDTLDERERCATCEEAGR